MTFCLTRTTNAQGPQGVDRSLTLGCTRRCSSSGPVVWSMLSLVTELRTACQLCSNSAIPRLVDQRPPRMPLTSLKKSCHVQSSLDHSQLKRSMSPKFRKIRNVSKNPVTTRVDMERVNIERKSQASGMANKAKLVPNHQHHHALYSNHVNSKTSNMPIATAERRHA